MASDYWVATMSDQAIRAAAKRARIYYGLVREKHVDIVSVLKSDKVWTIKGTKVLTAEVLLSSAMAGDDATTKIQGANVNMRFKAPVWEGAQFGVGRDRWTLGHELGHAALHHDKALMARSTGANVHSKRPIFIPTQNSAERQANIFASAFLVEQELLTDYTNPEEISVDFGVSFEAAKIYIERIVRQKNQGRNKERLAELAEELRSKTRPVSHSVRYAFESCTNCGNRTLIPIGIKYLCQTCESVTDHFQDGDQPQG